jgi:rhodanese-related sulfurtransferase
MVHAERTPPSELPVLRWREVVDAGAILIDVREEEEVATGTLPGAVNIPLGQLLFHVADFDPEVPIALLCRSGNRSGQAAARLSELGFVAINLTGGMLAVHEANHDKGDTQ